MHTHQRTLLARLGFADPDKQNKLHDYGCLFMAADIQMRRFMHGYAGSLHGYPFDSERLWDSDTQSVWGKECFEIERPLLKPRGTQPFGFADVCYDYGLAQDDGDTELGRGTIGIEIKIAPVPAGDLMRQIKTYRLSGIRHWVVAAHFMPDEATRIILIRERIPFVHLGDLFLEWTHRLINPPTPKPRLPPLAPRQGIVRMGYDEIEERFGMGLGRCTRCGDKFNGYESSRLCDFCEGIRRFQNDGRFQEISQ